MATPKSQRIGIWIIAIVMTVGTIGSFAVMILETENRKKETAEQNKLMEQYQKELDKQQKEADKLSKKYYSTFKKYKDVPAKFDMNSVDDKVKTKDLKVGKGDKIDKNATYQAYYIGWNPKGKVFDSSFDDKEKKLKAPLNTSTISGLIKGWEEGVIDMRVGGVREITIPSDLAYGEKGSGDTIPPNTPLKFIVMIIKKN